MNQHPLVDSLMKAYRREGSGPGSPEGTPEPSTGFVDPPPLAAFRGFIGDDADPDNVRLYRDESLQSWLLFRASDIVSRERIKDPAAPRGQLDLIWVDADARVGSVDRTRSGEVEWERAAAGTAPTEPGDVAPLALFEARVVDKAAGSAPRPSPPVSTAAQNPEFESRLREEFTRMVHARLGPEYRVYDVALTGHSIEIIAFVGAVGAVLQAYEPLRKSLDLLVKDLAGVLRRVLGQLNYPSVEVAEVSWSPGSALLERAPDGRADASPSRVGRMLGDRDAPMVYFVFAHALLLLFLLGLIAVLLVDALPSS